MNGNSLLKRCLSWQVGIRLCCEPVAAAMGSAGRIIWVAVLLGLSWAGADWQDRLVVTVSWPDPTETCSSNQGPTNAEPGLEFLFAFAFILITIGFMAGYVCSGLRGRPSRREVSTQTPCRYSWNSKQPRFIPVPEGVDGAWPQLLG